ncbi:hypothetical protein Tco_1015333 [Tanacetum coccineum]|uniref:Uncharacterized protein n=1 Tax=Tanacetum coccineum TaxID=301880 RepID=A0ABQ5FKI1_9ASTR
MDDEPMWDVDRVVAPTPGPAIIIPKTANEFAIKDIRKKRRCTSSLATSKKRRLLAFSPSEDPARKLEQMA